MVEDSNITGTYINNTAKGTSVSSGGGANFFFDVVKNTSISGTYYNNFAKINGGESVQ